MAVKKLTKLQFKPWDPAELKFLEEVAAREPKVKATDIVVHFQRKFPRSARSAPAVEHRVYKIRRLRQVEPRRSTMAPTPEVQVPTHGEFQVRLPTGAVITGTLAQVMRALEMLKG